MFSDLDPAKVWPKFDIERLSMCFGRQEKPPAAPRAGTAGKKPASGNGTVQRSGDQKLACRGSRTPAMVKSLLPNNRQRNISITLRRLIHAGQMTD